METFFGWREIALALALSAGITAIEIGIFILIE
jgi:hypothetical protein